MQIAAKTPETAQVVIPLWAGCCMVVASDGYYMIETGRWADHSVVRKIAPGYARSLFRDDWMREGSVAPLPTQIRGAVASGAIEC